MPMYEEALVAPLRAELTRLGAQELRSPAEVDAAVARPGTTLLVVNSVCGCAAGAMRPGVALALRHAARPDAVATVFAGQDAEATSRARHHFAPHPASSPSIALLKGGKVAEFISRQQIEGRAPQEVARLLIAAFDRHCLPGG